MNLLLYSVTAGLLFTLYLYYQLLDRVNHMDDWLDDNFGSESKREIYIIKEEDDEEKS